MTNGNTLTHDRVRDFFRDAHAAAARLGMVDVNVLMFEGRPAAFLYGYHCDGHVIRLRTGFDAALGEHGFGSALGAAKRSRTARTAATSSSTSAPANANTNAGCAPRTESTYRLTYTPIDSWRSQTVT